MRRHGRNIAEASATARFYPNFGRNVPKLVKRQDARRDAAAPRRLAARIAELEAENRALRAERWVCCG
jgi:hypothetical protein